MTSWCGAFYVFRNVASWKHVSKVYVKIHISVSFLLESECYNVINSNNPCTCIPWLPFSLFYGAVFTAIKYM